MSCIYGEELKEKWVDNHFKSFIKTAFKSNVEIGINEDLLLRRLRERSIYHTRSFTILCDIEKRKISILKRNSQSNKIFTAICLRGDRFTLKTGIAVAWAKYNHEIIPNFDKIKRRDELINGDKFLSKNSRKKYVFIGFLHQNSNSIGVVKVENATPAKLYKINLDKVITLVD